tara:strand:- start:2793 stop:3203 length:411 start_codon:yes stop_codon:yes gene_type:complete
MGMSKKTLSLIEEYASMGYEIIIGNNPRLPEAKKWANYECVRLCRTNSPTHGWSIRTVWAVRRAEVTKVEKFYNCDQHVTAFQIRGCKHYLVWLPRNKEFAIVDRDPGTSTWYSGDYLGHDNFEEALRTLREWEKS